MQRNRAIVKFSVRVIKRHLDPVVAAAVVVGKSCWHADYRDGRRRCRINVDSTYRQTNGKRVHSAF
jgi:hypothetical protein